MNIQTKYIKGIMFLVLGTSMLLGLIDQPGMAIAGIATYFTGKEIEVLAD